MSKNNIKPRDVEALFKQYKNLINHIYTQESSRFVYGSGTNRYADKMKQDDLYGYIVSEFVKLVKEYDAHSPVDFPLYIKEKLTLRTKHSYLKKLFKDWDREALGAKETSVEDMFEDSLNETDFKTKYDDSPLIDGLATTPLEKLVVNLWIEKGASNSEIIELVTKHYPDITKKEIETIITKLKASTLNRAKELNLMPKKGDKNKNKEALIERSKRRV